MALSPSNIKSKSSTAHGFGKDNGNLVEVEVEVEVAVAVAVAGDAELNFFELFRKLTLSIAGNSSLSRLVPWISLWINLYTLNLCFFKMCSEVNEL